MDGLRVRLSSLVHDIDNDSSREEFVLFSIASVVVLDVVFHRILFLFVCFHIIIFLTSTIAPLLEGFDVMLMAETRYKAS